MKNLCWALIVLAVCVVGVGFYRGWFAVTSSRPVMSDNINVNLTVDPNKMKEDGEKLKDKTKELTGQGKE